MGLLLDIPSNLGLPSPAPVTLDPTQTQTGSLVPVASTTPTPPHLSGNGMVAVFFVILAAAMLIGKKGSKKGRKSEDGES